MDHRGSRSKIRFNTTGGCGRLMVVTWRGKRRFRRDVSAGMQACGVPLSPSQLPSSLSPSRRACLFSQRRPSHAHGHGHVDARMPGRHDARRDKPSHHGRAKREHHPDMHGLPPREQRPPASPSRYSPGDSAGSACRSRGGSGRAKEKEREGGRPGARREPSQEVRVGL